MERKIVIIWGSVVVGLLAANLLYTWIILKGLRVAIGGLGEIGTKTLIELHELKKQTSENKKIDQSEKEPIRKKSIEELDVPEKPQQNKNQEISNPNSEELIKYDTRHWEIKDAKLKWIGGKQDYRPDSVAWVYMGTNDPCVIEFTHKKSLLEYPEYHVSAIIFGNGKLPKDHQDPWIQGAILNYSKNQGWLRTNGLYKAQWVQINRKVPKITSDSEHKCLISYSNNYLTFFVDDHKIVEKGPISFESRGSYLGFPVYWNNKLDEYEFANISINGKKIKIETPQSSTKPQQNP